MSQTSSDNPRHVAQLDQLIHDYLQQVDEGRAPDRAALLQQHPELTGELAAFFEDQDRIAGFALQMRLQETVGLAGAPQPVAAGVSTSAGGLPHSVRYFGRYEILEEIARGGMGVVYKARQSRLDRIVALKMILTGQFASSADVARFYSEAQAAANLEHPGIVPIYEVGQYGGQHYFSMAYVEGESLATALVKGPLPPLEAAALVGRLSEAVQFAHQRGVIHRDLKPANVLIDSAGLPHITDFGLAKHARGDSGLTATGQVLGTPSYMPPEQAAGEVSAIGPAADVYSLGAVLYAALTGRPPYQAATPLDTLMQVCNADPVSPRLLNPAVSRDLETICLKCLEKEPERRYASAADVAEDLRRFLADEPILARRQGPLVQCRRWVRKRRKTVTLVLSSIAAAAAVLIGGFLAWRSHEQAKLGYLGLTTNGPSLVAELFDDQGLPVAPSFPVPSSQPVELPEGSYRARISSSGIVSETYSLDVSRGQHVQYGVQSEDRSVWPPLEVQPGDLIDPISLPRRGTGLLRYRGPDASFRLLDGATGKPVWPQDLVLDKSNLPPGAGAQEWPLLLGSGTPWQVPPYAILGGGSDGDDTIIFGSRRLPALIAVSAKMGKVLWMFRGLPTVDGVKDPTHLHSLQNSNLSPVIGKPVVALGGEGGPMVLAAFFSTGESFQADGKYITAEQQIWLEAVSGKTGKSLWRRPIKQIGNSMGQQDVLPVALEAIEQPQIVKLGELQAVLVASDKRLYGFDLSTGKDAWPPFDLGFLIDAAPKIMVDPKGAVAPIATVAAGRLRSGSFTQSVTLTITAISLDDRRQLWQTKTDGFPPRSMPHVSPTDVPDFELAALQSDGLPAIVAPVQIRTNSGGQPFGQTMLKVLDAARGNVRWSQPLLWTNSFVTTPAVRWLVGPDLDGDGYREIFAAWVGQDPKFGFNLIVAAFSGRDGRTLWRWMRPGVSPQEDVQGGMCWWTPAASGQPQLVVPVHSGLNGNGQGATVFLDSADGSLLETLPEVSDPRSADLDGDGLADLFYTVKPQGYARLMTVRGAPPAPWRRLDFEQLEVAADVDHDGIADLLSARSGNIVSAISGRDGKVLWHGQHPTAMSGPVAAVPALALPADDKRGSSDPAVLVLDHRWDGQNTLKLRALSGRDGRDIWPDPDAGNIHASFGSSSQFNGYRYYSYPGTGGIYLNSKRPDAWAAAVDPNPNNLSQIWLHVVSGTTGKLKWKAPFASGMFGEPGRIYRDEFADLNGDGVADVVGWGSPANGQPGAFVLKAYSGADGTPLWTDAPPVLASDVQNAGIDLPLVTDLEGQGEPDILFIRQRRSGPNQNGTPSELVAISGRTGREKWTWQWANVGLPLLPPLAVAFDGPGRRCVCLSITEVIAKNGGTVFQPCTELVVLDPAGKVCRRIELKGTGMHLPDSTSFWRKADLLGDGREELLIDDASALQALGGAAIEPLWNWPWHDAAKLLDILPARKDVPATIAVWAGKSVYGISGPTGRPLWRGEMPSGFAPTYGRPEQVLLRDENGAGWPRLLAGSGCRLTWPTEESGRYTPPAPAPRSYVTVADPVAVRRLPWVPPSDDDVWTLVSIIFWAVVWLVVPWLLLRACSRRDSWWLAFIPAFYQLATVLTLNQIPAEWLPWIPPGGKLDPHFIVGCMSLLLLVASAIYSRRLVWLTVDASVVYAAAVALAWSHLTWSGLGSGQMPGGKQPIGEGLDTLLVILVFAIPTIAAVWLPARWIRRGQWRPLVAFLVVSLILGVAWGAFRLARERSWMPEPEQYSLAGWWWIFGWGLYFASLFTLLAWLAKRAFRSGRTAAGVAVRFVRRRSG